MWVAATRKIVQTWIAISVIGSTLAIGTLSLIRSVPTIGKPFAGFFFGPNLLVAIGQRESWPGIQQGLRSLDRILAVDGSPLSSSEDLLQRVIQHRPGEVLIYRIEREGMLKDIGVPVSQYSFSDFIVVFLAPFLMGLLFVTFGAVLYLSQPFTRGSPIYLLFCCFIGAISMSIYEAYTSFTFFRVVLMYPLIGGLSVHLFSMFPDTKLNRPHIRAWVGFVYALSLVLVLWRQFKLGDPYTSASLSGLSSLFVLLVLLTNGFFLVRAFYRTFNPIIRDRIKILGVGLSIGSLTILIWALNFLLREAKSFYLDEGILIAAIFPLFMGYAIVRKNVFKLDQILRLSLSYGVSAALVLVLYVGILGAIQELLPEGLRSRYLGILIVFLAGFGAFLFNKLRNQINNVVYQTLFRSQFDLSNALSRLDRSLSAGMSLVELSEKVATKLVELLDVEKIAVLGLSPKRMEKPIGSVFRWKNPPSFEKWLSLFDKENFLEELRKKNTPFSVRKETDVSHPFPRSMALLLSQDIEVVLPCISSDQLYGLIFLGHRFSRTNFDRMDFQLLRPVAERFGLVLENAQLTLETTRQAQLAALGEMASVLVHDIKNPLSTIKISAGSMKRRFREGDHCFELATIVEEEVDRMDRTVGEILTFAKPTGLLLRPGSIHEVIRSTIKRCQPLLEKAGVEIQSLLCEKEAWIQMDEGKLIRVMENLLINAKEATSKGKNVFVKTSLESDSRMVVTVEDQGTGIDPQVQEKIFQPFFTTKAHGTGLGLAIVRQIVLDHGGEIEVDSVLGQGTRFTLAFPVLPVMN